MHKVTNWLWFLTITLTLTLIALISTISPSNAGTDKANDNLRKTAVMVNGMSCLGSGSIVQGKSGRHYLLTNAHVCGCAKYKGSIFATYEGGALVKARVVKQDWTSDLCAARVEDGLPALQIGASLPKYTEVTTRGYPGERLTESHGFTRGNVDWAIDMELSEIGQCPPESKPEYGFNGAVVGCRLNFTSTLSSLYARPGASGSAVVNNNGELVGVVSSFHPDEPSDSGQTTFEQTKKFIESL